MPEIQDSERERENLAGVQGARGGGHGDLPVDDPPARRLTHRNFSGQGCNPLPRRIIPAYSPIFIF
jgi:hypothetical protein